METKALDLETALLYAIRVGNTDGIPAVEQDVADNKYYLLIFTSEELAKKYCSLRCPRDKDQVYQLERQTHKGKPTQTGLIRVARKCDISYKNIAGAIFDHPGIPGIPAVYVEMVNLVSSVQLKPKQTVSEELISHLSSLDSGEDL